MSLLQLPCLPLKLCTICPFPELFWYSLLEASQWCLFIPYSLSSENSGIRDDPSLLSALPLSAVAQPCWSDSPSLPPDPQWGAPSAVHSVYLFFPSESIQSPVDNHPPPTHSTSKLWGHFPISPFSSFTFSQSPSPLEAPWTITTGMKLPKSSSLAFPFHFNSSQSS